MSASRSTRSLRTWLAAGLGSCALLACGGGGDMPAYGGGTPGGGGNGMGTSYAMSRLVSNGSGTTYQDTHLVNGWGVAFNPAGYVWVANAGTSTSTLYDGHGVPQSLVVAIPAGTAGSAHPTGIVYNASGDFAVSQGGNTAASVFLFVGEAGTLSGWAPSVNLNAAVTVVDGSAAGKSYKGLALAAQGSANFLYATDFHNGTIDVYDTHFAAVAPAGAFADPALPAGYAPFGIQAIGNKIYVAFAKQDASATDEVPGAGFGVVDVFDTSGHLLQRLVSGGPLNAPWGMAMAPANFGPFSNALLVGNFGDGKINAFNPSTGAHLGTLSAANGSPIVVDGLWGIAFGNGINSQPTNTLFFAAGPNDEADGLYGRIDVQ